MTLKVEPVRVIVRVHGDPDADDESAATLGAELARISEATGVVEWKKSGDDGFWHGSCGDEAAAPRATRKRAVKLRKR
jgi:hypothetical protein